MGAIECIIMDGLEEEESEHANRKISMTKNIPSMESFSSREIAWGSLLLRPMSHAHVGKKEVELVIVHRFEPSKLNSTRTS